MSVDAATGRVTYAYDEGVEDSPPPAAGALAAAALDGSPIAALGGVVVSGSRVTALFAPSVATAVMFANPFGTVFDKAGLRILTRAWAPAASSAVAGAAPPPPPPAAIAARS